MPKFPADTMLERFIRKHELTVLDIAYEAKLSRQHLLRIRKGEADPGIWTAVRIRDACGRLLGRFVSIDELFGPTDPQAVRMRAKRSK
jgi:DNA-binding XRE family transcriptional regulator